MRLYVCSYNSCCTQKQTLWYKPAPLIWVLSGSWSWSQGRQREAQTIVSPAPSSGSTTRCPRTRWGIYSWVCFGVRTNPDHFPTQSPFGGNSFPELMSSDSHLRRLTHPQPPSTQTGNQREPKEVMDYCDQWCLAKQNLQNKECRDGTKQYSNNPKALQLSKI